MTYPWHEPDEELDADEIYDRAADKADLDRKREKEDGYVPPPLPSDEAIRRRWDELNKSDTARRTGQGRR